LQRLFFCLPAIFFIDTVRRAAIRMITDGMMTIGIMMIRSS